ncbi:hypothetical protein ACHAXT_013195 [Thalassiosira profunda]
MVADEPSPDDAAAKGSGTAAIAADGAGGSDEIIGGSSAPSHHSEPSHSDGTDTALRTTPPTAAVDAASSSASPSFRKRMGAHLSSAADAINNNLIVVRYATVSSVLLLGLYGVANTPLFYRYTNLLDIPSRIYVKRKWIHGRLVGVMEREAARDANATTTRPQPIVVLFRHSSPMERLLTQSAMERILSFAGKSPRLLYSAANPYRNLLPIELAGVAAPPSWPNASPSILSESLKGGEPGDRFPTLDRLVREKTKISLQLLARRTTPDNAPNRRELEGKQLPGDGESKETAIGHLHYRKPEQWISTTNASQEMVGQGEACLNPNGTVVPLSETDDGDIDNESNTAIADFDPTVKQLQQDAAFVSRLEEAEYTAWKAKRGMWSSDRMRETKREYAEEAAAARGGWRAWARRGLGWLSGGRL